MTSAKVSNRRPLDVRPQSIPNILAAVLLGSILLAPAARADNDEVVHTVGKVSYVSGGVGTESQDQLSSLVKDFNLKLVFALKSGEFVSSVKISIADAKGKSLLNTTCEGPWLLAKLPAGSYQVSASFAGNAQTRKRATSLSARQGSRLSIFGGRRSDGARSRPQHDALGCLGRRKHHVATAASTTRNLTTFPGSCAPDNGCQSPDV